MVDLTSYEDKRDRNQTPEPFGSTSDGKRSVNSGAWRSFVVQQHAARRMHWDLRLEADGVLASWAVPKGPTFDATEKRLAVRTEDHPLAYSDFEGVIPEGNYGAGAMIVWDRGRYRSIDGNSPAEGIDVGKLDLVLDGHKLSGRFALVRTKRGEGKHWLLLRKGKPPGDVLEPVLTWPESVFSGLTVAQLRDGVTREAELSEAAKALGAPRRVLDPKAVRPMLASTSDTAFSRNGWIFEVKFDGVRVLAVRRSNDVRLYSRTGRDCTALYPEVAESLTHLPADDFVLDGEIVTLDDRGRSSFERLQKRFSLRDDVAIDQARTEIPVVLYAFDLLSAAGYDVRSQPLHSRKELLSRIAPRRGPVRFSDHIEGDGHALYEAASRNELEGIIAKRADSKYDTGRRSKSWQKIKVPRSAPLVIVGIVSGKGSRRDFGSLMLAWHRDGLLSYAGNVGSGFDDATIDALGAELRKLHRSTPAFDNSPKTSRAQTWVEPMLVCEVRFTEITESGALRHPVFVRRLGQIDPAECVAPPSDGLAAREFEPLPTGSGRPEPALEFSRLDKVFWPVEGYTKGDLLAYYEAAWPWLAPYLRDRPIVLTRYPDGIEGKSFYQKNAPGFTPDWARHIDIDGTDYFVCNDQRTLLYIINSGAIPLHVWSARLTSIEKPDWLILDLDPKGAPFTDVVKIARHIYRLLRRLDVEPFVKTSGQDGLHVMLPLGARIDHADAKTLGQILARTVCGALPDIATIVRPVAQRGGKVYVDFLQNGRGKLIASPFSVRPRPHAPISMPLPWTKVTSRLDPTRFTMTSALPMLEKGGDPLAGVLGNGIDVEAVLRALVSGLLGQP